MAMISVDNTKRPFTKSGNSYFRRSGVKGYRVPSTGVYLEGSGSGDAGIRRPSFGGVDELAAGVLLEHVVDHLRYGRAEEHERTLDFRSGTLRRQSVWAPPTGRRVRITSAVVPR